MDFSESIHNSVIANLVATLIAAVVSGIVLGIGGILVFGRNYKQRIAALESRSSQPAVVNNVTNIYQGEKSVYRAPKATFTEGTRSDREDEVRDDEAAYMRKPSATNITGDVSEIRTLTQAQYDALAVKRDRTLYLIVDKR